MSFVYIRIFASMGIFETLSMYSDWAPVALRVALGVIFFAHGLQKFKGGIPGVADFLENLGIKPKVFWAWVLTLGELIGGGLVFIGLFTQFAASVLAIIMLVAIFKFKLKQGLINGYELDLALLAGAVALMLLGGGILSFDSYFWSR